MFQPETEDMLPRMAPKPIPDVISGSSESIIRPQVPEVSIMFGQQDTNNQQRIYKNPLQQQSKDFPPQTYAAWKKQMLPKVTFPAHANCADLQLQENGIVMTGYKCTTTNANPIQLNTKPIMKVASNENVFGSRKESVEIDKPVIYRRSLESCNGYQPIQNYQILPLHQRPVEAVQYMINQLPQSSTKEVLTICAGTQTDSYFEPTNNFHIPAEFLAKLATKKDVENISQVLVELRAEQQRILKLLETIVFSGHLQMTKETHCRDVSVQTDFTDMDNATNKNGDIAYLQNHQSAPKNKFIEHLKPNNIMLSPKGKPIAQSTAYRPNTLQIKDVKYDTPLYQEPNNPTGMTHKSASDTSLAMNELALKYLPNEKLAELLKELNMDCPTVVAKANEPTTPNRENFDKLGKGPSDISNASYKYLKKYRLLPEDHVEIREISDGMAMQNDIENRKPQCNSPQCSSPQYVQNSPINQRQAPTNKCSPYAADRLPLSPLARASSSTVPQHIVDLDNIKHQPKFL